MSVSSGHDATTTEKLSQELLQSLDALFGLHPGFRPVHAKGAMCFGTFTPSSDVTSLTRAPHVARQSIKVIARFSNFAGIPTVHDNDPMGGSPRGFALRFYLADHVHTDIVAHSYDGFPTRTGEEFLEFARALASSRPDAPKPTAIESFLARHPHAKTFAEADKPIPSSFARESFFGVNAMRFTNKDGVSRYGRYRILPAEGTEYLDAAALAGKNANFLFDELSERLSRGPIKLHIWVQMAQDGDEVSDATVVWPESRPQMDFGLVTLDELVAPDDAEAGRIIFDPIPRVDGIDPSDDPLIELRAAIYLLSGRRRRVAASG